MARCLTVMLIALCSVKGRNVLEHLVYKSKVTDADVANLLLQLLRALAYLHARSVCHLDCRVCTPHHIMCELCIWPPLQPPNILVSKNQQVETVKLTDFGAARHFGCSHQSLPLEHSYESPAGYNYLAPETFQQQPLGAAADIW